jgi:hypothetical protein
LRELIGRYAPAGKQIPVISGEWGYSNINWDKNPLSNNQQAQYLARMFLTNLYQGIAVSIWYDWKNDGTDPNEREHNFGTVGHDLQPKTVYLAAQTLASTLSGYTIKSRMDLSSDKDFVFRMATKNKPGIVFWTIGEEHEWTLPLKAGEGTLVDMLGSKTEIPWQTAELKIRLSPSPQYLLITGK